MHSKVGGRHSKVDVHLHAEVCPRGGHLLQLLTPLPIPTVAEIAPGHSQRCLESATHYVVRFRVNALTEKQ